MIYYSTRNKTVKATSAEAVLQGLAPDGGLFMPESFEMVFKSFEFITIQASLICRPKGRHFGLKNPKTSNIAFKLLCNLQKYPLSETFLWG